MSQPLGAGEDVLQPPDRDLHCLAGTGHSHMCPDQSLAFSVKYKTAFGHTRSPAQPAKTPQPSPGGASSMDESGVSSPRGFRDLAMPSPARLPAQSQQGGVGEQQSQPESCSEHQRARGGQ